ncbi:APC family permease [Saccharolobus shibatae]|nr:APC family permease [Saccharolobus shibatae]QXJ31223.1 putative amino acid transporter [Saccharolobus shibatae]QXJ34238.1 putative amino acid transporter [Saccharolobus shibatae]
MPDKNQSVFIRQSSGLVREVSPWASFFATFGLVTGGIPILIVSWLYLAPGANWTLSYLISLLPTLGMAFLFYIASISTPRSGGDYVFQARSSHSLVAFVNYWALWIAFALSLGLYSYLGAQWFAYLFSGLGLFYNDQALLNLGSFFTTTLGSVIVGIIILIMGAIVASIGKYGWSFVFVTGIISILSTIITFVALVLISPSQFSSALSSFTGVNNAYDEVISTATSNGLSFVSPLYGALLAIPVVWYYYVWYNLPASWSGEMKKVKYNSLLGIVVAVLFIGVYYILFTSLNLHAFGERFLTSWSYISANSLNSTVYNDLSTMGTFTPFFALLVNHNVFLYIIMWIAFWLPNFYSNPPLVVSLTRYLFAWAFDRIMPEKLADVNERFHIPLISTIITVIVGIIGVLLYAYVSSISIVDVTVIFEISYGIFALTTALSPFIKRNFFNRGVHIKNIGGIPIVSLIGFPVFGFLLYALYQTWGNPVLLPINFPTILSLVIIYASGIMIYVASYIINKQRGIQMNLIFEEIPPE